MSRPRSDPGPLPPGSGPRPRIGIGSVNEGRGGGRRPGEGSAPSAISPLRPSDFARQALDALDAAEGRRRRRKRDTTPDAIGLGIKRDLLARLSAEDPPVEGLEPWLLRQIVGAPASGPVRALCTEILAEYRYAWADPIFRGWLAEGAPSADADLAPDEVGPTRVRIPHQESPP